MITVVLRTGKVLRYNQAKSYEVEENTICLWGNKKKNEAIAQIPLEIIERVEFGRPCEILRAKLKPTKGHIY